MIMKLSKQTSAAHQKAKQILNQESPLTFDQKIFVLENYHEGAENMNNMTGAFFTPMGLAHDFAIALSEKSTVDLCAGIGMLSFCAYHFAEVKEITCIEINPAYVEAGKKILPEATWICGSVFDYELIATLDKFDQSISNPPFGNITRAGTGPRLKYTGGNFELMTVEIASMISKKGTFILPQLSTPFMYSGKTRMETNHVSEKYEKFAKQTGFEMEFNYGIDTSFYINDWKGVTPMCEIVHVDFPQTQLSFF